jgi:cytochrome P450
MEVMLAVCLCAVFTGVVYLWIRRWYGRLVLESSLQVCHSDGRLVPGDPPQTLFGNLPAVYRQANRLAAYNGLHTRLGEIVQLFWLWRPQVSVSGYGMALRVLQSNQSNYRKQPPNAVLQRLFGSSVLSENGEGWKRHRAVMRDIFSARHVGEFQELFLAHVERLAAKWERRLLQPAGADPFDVLPDLTAMSLDVVGHAALGRDFRAIEGGADAFLEAFQYILAQSTRPVHVFITWWKDLPLPSSRRLQRAFRTVDEFLDEIIHSRREIADNGRSGPVNLIDSLLAATSASGDTATLTDREVRDNLLAILANGHQTVAICVALTLYLLARHPDALRKAREEIDAFGAGKISELSYLDAVITESLRLYPAAAGLQRRSIDSDVLDGWSVPPGRAVGISLMPLHANSEYFGEAPEQFRPERYLVRENAATPGTNGDDRVAPSCPFHKPNQAPLPVGAKTRGTVCLPLSFGAGARKCLGEHFAMHEMKVVLAVLLRRFDLRSAEGFEPDLDLDRFGLFIALQPLRGVRLAIAPRRR